MSWNFRIIRSSRPGGGEAFAIHEVYYESDISDQYEMDARKRPKSICPDPHKLIGLDVEELRRCLSQMTQALSKPPVDGDNYHVRVRYERKRNKSVAEDMNRELRRAEREAKDWKKQYLKANSDRIALARELADLKQKQKKR